MNGNSISTNPVFSERDFHLLATALARTINRDLELLQEGEAGDFMRDLIIERIELLIRLEREAGKALQIYLTNPQTVYANLCAERNAANIAFNKSQTKRKTK